MPVRCHTPTVLKANEFGVTLASRLQQLRKDGDFVDCKIRLKTADGHSKELHAHRNVLASGSNFFKEAFRMKVEKVRLSSADFATVFMHSFHNVLNSMW